MSAQKEKDMEVPLATQLRTKSGLLAEAKLKENNAENANETFFTIDAKNARSLGFF